MVPPRIAPMLTSGRNPAPAAAGRKDASKAAQRAAHHQQRSQNSARGAGPERHGPDGRFHQKNAEQ